ncbi:MAG TPA: metallophosphoesterase [Asticcacaulis sp.]|nr:metallophosphoesterase [Asticcacaulis sp.]
MPHISQLTYAIGDIHGYDVAFERLVERIRNDAARIGERPRIVLLGDYIDRGPNSRGVLDRILRLEKTNWCDLVVLKGNHEDALLRFLDDPDYGRTWGTWGGAQTVANYGIDMPDLGASELTWEGTSDAFSRAFDPAHLALLERLPAIFIDGDYLFVHAGVDPDKPLAEQDAETFMYIRGRFLRADKACDYVVVHGHTPDDEPFNAEWRIDVDTGIYFNGVLTAVRLRGEERTFLQVELSDAEFMPWVRLA